MIAKFAIESNDTDYRDPQPRGAPAELAGDVEIPQAELADYQWKSLCRGLFLTPAAAEY